MPLASKPSLSHVKTQETGQSPEARWETRTPNNAPQQYAPNEYFNFPDMDRLMHDFSSRHPEPDLKDPSPAQEGYQLDPTLNDDDPVFYTLFLIILYAQLNIMKY